MATTFDLVEDLILNYDPEFPQQRFIAGEASELALLSTAARLPSPVKWPDGKAPVPVPLTPAPHETSSLENVAGWDHVDAIVVTWTAAEAAALAAIFTPEYLPSTWYEYRHGVKAYIPLVTGKRAPFNSSEADMARYRHSLGLYFPCTVNGRNVLLFKSGLHLDYDGPAIPVRKLMIELATTLKPSVFITTGTGGGINGVVEAEISETKLGDVIIAPATVFDCQQQFADALWATDGPFPTSALSQAALSLMTPDLLRVNAAKIPGAEPIPNIWHGPGCDIVTTDFFGFSDTLNTYHLQGKGRACDMGDAMVGAALTSAEVKIAVPDLRWFAIRNASDPEMPDNDGDVDAAEKQAGEIYLKYGTFTTAASAIATWAVIASM